MPSAADRLEFAPPQPPGMLRAFGLAVVAHVLLLVALTWGISWKRDAENLAVEAELWSSIPQQAAPKQVEVQPPPAPKVIEPPKPQPVKEAQIAVEKEKPKPEPKKPPPKVEPKPEPPKKVAETPKPKASSPKQLAEADAKQREVQRQENLKRMAGLAGASGAPDSTGKAMQSTKISDAYASRLQARIRPFIVSAEDFPRELVTDVEVRTSPDGTIIGTPRIAKSSGDKRWDERAVRVLIATEVLPRDETGRVPSPMIIGVRPKN